MKQFKFILVSLAMFCFLGANAQEDQSNVGSYFSKFRPAKKWSVGLQLSPTVLSGDAADRMIGLSGGAHIKYSVSQSFGLKMSGNIGVIKGGRAEPSGVDNKGSSDSYEFKNNFKETNKTIVMITHGILEAKFLCDKLMIINNGEIEQFDTTQKVMNSPAEGFVSDFLNSQN